MPVPFQVTKITRATLHLIFPDISWELHNDNIASNLEREQAIRVVDEIKNRKVYSGKYYGGKYFRGEVPTKEVIVKVVGPTSGVDEFESIEKEYAFYRQLTELQGTVIPRCFGIFRAHRADDQAIMTCLVLERCIPAPIYDKEEFNRQVMVAVCNLHQKTGVIHNNLMSGSHILRQGTSPRIVDLSQAKIHLCRGCHPANHLGTISNEFKSCWELAELEKRLWNDVQEAPISYISQVVEAGTKYLNRQLDAVMKY